MSVSAKISLQRKTRSPCWLLQARKFVVLKAFRIWSTNLPLKTILSSEIIRWKHLVFRKRMQNALIKKVERKIWWILVRDPPKVRKRCMKTTPKAMSKWKVSRSHKIPEQKRFSDWHFNIQNQPCLWKCPLLLWQVQQVDEKWFW